MQLQELMPHMYGSAAGYYHHPLMFNQFHHYHHPSANHVASNPSAANHSEELKDLKQPETPESLNGDVHQVDTKHHLQQQLQQRERETSSSRSQSNATSSAENATHANSDYYGSSAYAQSNWQH